MKIGIYCYLIADILTKLLQKCSLSGLQPNISFLARLYKSTGRAIAVTSVSTLALALALQNVKAFGFEPMDGSS